jgi:hypothetical protein
MKAAVDDPYLRVETLGGGRRKIRIMTVYVVYVGFVNKLCLK